MQKIITSDTCYGKTGSYATFRYHENQEFIVAKCRKSLVDANATLFWLRVAAIDPANDAFSNISIFFWWF